MQTTRERLFFEKYWYFFSGVGQSTRCRSSPRMRRPDAHSSMCGLGPWLPDEPPPVSSGPCGDAGAGHCGREPCPSIRVFPRPPLMLPPWLPLSGCPSRPSVQSHCPVRGRPSYLPELFIAAARRRRRRRRRQTTGGRARGRRGGGRRGRGRRRARRCGGHRGRRVVRGICVSSADEGQWRQR